MPPCWQRSRTAGRRSTFPSSLRLSMTGRWTSSGTSSSCRSGRLPVAERQYLLDDDAVKQFIVQGYLLVETRFPAEFHEAICGQIEEVFRSEGNPGNGILERVPALAQVYDDPAVKGALASLLGPGMVMHPHRHCHTIAPHSG